MRQRITDHDSMEQARKLIGVADVVIAAFADSTNIPLELLIAEAQAERAQVVKELITLDEGPIVAGVLESGPSGVLVRLADVDAASALAAALQTRTTVTAPLEPFVVTDARPIGMGHRGCVDTTTLFGQDEGMLVGSTSCGGILVCAEVHYLPYMNLRPFRVNAGAVHSYVFGPRYTDYITDLRAGAAAWAVSASGLMRPTQIGRVKTEVRPLRLIEAEAAGVRVNVMLQDDWHVRVMGSDGKPRNLTDVRPGDELLGRLFAPGRHVGLKVEETIDER